MRHEPLQLRLDPAVVLPVHLEAVAQAGQEVIGIRLDGLELVPEAVQRRDQRQAGVVTGYGGFDVAESLAVSRGAQAE